MNPTLLDALTLTEWLKRVPGGLPRPVLPESWCFLFGEGLLRVQGLVIQALFFWRLQVRGFGQALFVKFALPEFTGR